MRRFTRRLALAVLTVGLAGAATAGTWAVANAADWSTASQRQGASGYGPMMGTRGLGPGGGMVCGNYGLTGDGSQVGSMEVARERAQLFADGLGLSAGEVMWFSNGFYVELETPDGAGATEVLVDASDGAVGVEPGPATMWNTHYGMHATGADIPATVSAQQAVTLAQRWLDDQRTGMTADEPEAFPGYYTLHTLRDGRIVGMLSVNAATGAVWYHTWHGDYRGMDEG